MEPIHLSGTTKAYQREYEGERYYSIHSPEDGVTVAVTLPELAAIPEVKALVRALEGAFNELEGMPLDTLLDDMKNALAPFEEEVG